VNLEIRGRLQIQGVLIGGGGIANKIRKIGRVNEHGIIAADSSPARIHRGDIAMVDFRGAHGSVQSGVRPAVVVSNDTGNKYSPTVIVVPVTTADKNPWQGTHADLGYIEFLDVRTMALAEQISALDKRYIIKKMGRLADGYMWRVEHAIRVAVGGNERHDLVCC